jgi:TolB-like protein/DNA-binding SARP family transcriptional activator
MSDRRPSPPSSLRTLGGLTLERDGLALPAAASQPRKLALLALVAASGTAGGGIARDRVLGLLWPELTQARARHALAQLRYAIGRDLGGDPFVPGRDLRLDPGLVVSDRESLEAAVAVGDAERVAQLYRGPWLDGFFLSNAPEFERWMEEERGSLHTRVVATLRRAAREAATGADPEIAADRWGSLLAVEPMDAEGAVQRMRALVRIGDRSGAIAVARAHREARARELQLPPDPAVSQLEAQLLDEARRVVPPALPTPEGRAPVAPEPTVTRTDRPDGVAVPPLTRRAPRRRIAWGAGVAVGAALGAAVLAAALADADRPAATAAPSADGAGSDSAPPAPASARSVAVMRFRSIGETPEDRYFADGVSEEIIQTLARLDGVHVSSRSSSFALSTDTLTARDVGRRLGVETLVEGSVRRERDRLRLSVRLIDAANGYTRWSETFDRPATDVFAVQEAIARAIAGALRVRLAEGTPLIAPQRTTDPQTYDLYLRGRYLWWNSASERGVQESVREFRRALARDSTFAPAWVGLADAHFELTAFHDVAPRAVVSTARAALLRALALDSTLADVHASLGYLHTFHDRDWAAAESRFRRALALDPRHGRAHLWYAWMLAARARHAEALREIRVARSLEPLDPLIAVRVGTMRYLAGDAEGAASECRRVAEESRGFAIAHRQLGEALLQQPGQAVAGVSALRRAAALSPTTETRARLAYGLARAGAVADARRLLAELEQGAAQAYVSPLERARVLVGLGERERALDLLERAYDAGASTLVLLAVDPAFAPLRPEPRFRSLLRRLGLPA